MEVIANRTVLWPRWPLVFGIIVLISDWDVRTNRVGSWKMAGIPTGLWLYSYVFNMLQYGVCEWGFEEEHATYKYHCQLCK